MYLYVRFKKYIRKKKLKITYYYQITDKCSISLPKVIEYNIVN